MREAGKTSVPAARFGAMQRLAFLLLVACSDPPAAAPTLTAEPVAPPPEHIVEHPVEPSVAPAAPAPAANVSYGDVYIVGRRRWGDGPFTALVEVPPEPRPSGPVVGYAETHHSFWEFRALAEETVGPAPIVLVQTYPTDDVCEASVRRARRLHATHVADESGAREEFGEETFLALEYEPCNHGTMAIVGVSASDVHVRPVHREALTDPAPVELVDLVRDSDREWADPPAAADYRMLVLPELDLTIVAGNQPFVIRGGRRLNERWGGFPTRLIEAAGHVFFEVGSVSEDWTSSLDCFYPTYLAGTCEVTDASGTPTNVRGGPSGRSPVVTTVTTGATLTADDHVGSWFHVLTSPPGWVHTSAVQCGELPPAPQPCP